MNKAWTHASNNAPCRRACGLLAPRRPRGHRGRLIPREKGQNPFEAPSKVLPCFQWKLLCLPRTPLRMRSTLPSHNQQLAPIFEAMVTGLFSEGSGARRCISSRRLPVTGVSATHPNPAWRPKQPSCWPPNRPALHQTVLWAAPGPRRGLTVAPLIRIRGATVRLWWGYGAMSGSPFAASRSQSQGSTGTSHHPEARRPSTPRVCLLP
jgi:hypothetical protein